MPRPDAKPELNSRFAYTVLGWNMQKVRRAEGWRGKDVATAFGCHQSHVSRVETGKTKPSRGLVEFYEQAFACEGLLLSLYEVAAGQREQERRRVGGHRSASVAAAPGDKSLYVDDTIPHGTHMRPGEPFVKTWWIKNVGSVPWEGRVLERQGPLDGPGLISSRRYYEIPTTQPGDVAEIKVKLKAPTYDATSIAYFKMAHGEGQPLCFPDKYQLGLDVLVRVTGQLDPNPDP